MSRKTKRCCINHNEGRCVASLKKKQTLDSHTNTHTRTQMHTFTQLSSFFCFVDGLGCFANSKVQFANHPKCSTMYSVSSPPESEAGRRRASGRIRGGNWRSEGMCGRARGGSYIPQLQHNSIRRRDIILNTKCIQNSVRH